MTKPTPNRGIIITGGTFNAEQVAVGDGAQARKSETPAGSGDAGPTMSFPDSGGEGADAILPPKSPFRVFLSYAHEDRLWCDELRKHLRALERTGWIQIWYDRQIRAGVDWGSEIVEQLESADVVLLLISADFIDSDYAYGLEARRALERGREGAVVVIPVVVRSVVWEDTPFARLQALPSGASPVSEWPDRDAALTSTVMGIRERLRTLIRS